MKLRYNTRHLSRVCLVLALVAACMPLLTGCLDPKDEPAGTATPAPTPSLPGPTSEEPFYDLRDLAVTPDGTAWAATGEGLLRLQGERWESVLVDTEVNALAVSPDGSLWVGVGCNVKRFDGVDWEDVARCGEYLLTSKVLDIDFTPVLRLSTCRGFTDVYPQHICQGL